MIRAATHDYQVESCECFERLRIRSAVMFGREYQVPNIFNLSHRQEDVKLQIQKRCREGKLDRQRLATDRNGQSRTVILSSSSRTTAKNFSKAPLPTLVRENASTMSAFTAPALATSRSSWFPIEERDRVMRHAYPSPAPTDGPSYVLTGKGFADRSALGTRSLASVVRTLSRSKW